MESEHVFSKRVLLAATTFRWRSGGQGADGEGVAVCAAIRGEVDAIFNAAQTTDVGERIAVSAEIRIGRRGVHKEVQRDHPDRAGWVEDDAVGDEDLGDCAGTVEQRSVADAIASVDRADDRW